jgi:protein-tyrosine-phosphatase
MSDRPLRLLFVCQENANRSQMAEAFARIHGGGVVEAASAGSRPSGQVNVRAIASMAERGYDLARHRSKSVADLSAEPWDCVVTMGCGDECPHVVTPRREDWAIPDPRDLPPEKFARVRDEIERRVLDLLARLHADADGGTLRA